MSGSIGNISNAAVIYAISKRCLCSSRNISRIISYKTYDTANAATATGITTGKMVDYGVKDSMNMGAAMAPAAADTIYTHLKDFSRTPDDYDLIVTGDLGQLGKELLLELGKRNHLPLGGKLDDCGTLVFDNTVQDVHAGGSGCGCGAVTLCGYLLNQLNKKKLKNILFCGTGALLSPTSSQQGLAIPGVCHAVAISGG